MTVTVHEWLKDSVPVVVSIAVLFVTLSFNGWQKRLAKQKLRHDLYDRRIAIYVAFWELLTALPDTKKSDDDFKALLLKANSARYHVNLPTYLEQLCTQINEEVIGPIMYLDAMNKQIAAIQNDPEAVKKRVEAAARLGAAKLDIPQRHLKELNQEFAELKLTDFWK